MVNNGAEMTRRPGAPERCAPPSAHRTTGRRPAGTRAATALFAVLLLLASCSSDDSGADGGDGPSDPAQPEDRSTGGPTTAPGSGTDPVSDGIRIEVLSSQPDRVTGADARVRITPARGSSVDALTVTLGSTDITEQFHSDGAVLEGVVEDLVEGTNTLTASDGESELAQRLRAWPITGPMISGEHVPLLACSTEQHGLGAPIDDHCTAPTQVRWSYVTTDGDLTPLEDPAAALDPARAPSDLATTSRRDGDSEDQSPLLVRHEIGVINRSVYEIAVIDPSGSTGVAPRPAPSNDLWNGRLVYRYGDGCGTTYGQGTSTTEVLDVTRLSQGYALATATFNSGAVSCHDVLSAETTMMVKERFIEVFGVPELTIGEGEGFGAAQALLIIQNYPSLLDGAVASDPFADIVTVANGSADCALLQSYYRSPAGTGLSAEQRTAINGHATPATCATWEADHAHLVDPTTGCDPAAEVARIYDPTTNPGGVRCTLQDLNSVPFGRDETGYANRLLDNVGVQYGLEALNESVISVEEFLDLNASIGGYDIDGEPTEARHQADLEAVQRAYETGRVSTSVGDQVKVPIVLVDRYDDPDGSVADRVRAFSFRRRLTYGAGPESVPGLQIWTHPTGLGPAPESTAPVPDPIDEVDEWLTALLDDREGDEIFHRLRRARPAAAIDHCILQVGEAPVSGFEVYDDGEPCAEAYPVAGDPRIASGAPLSNDIIKCQLKPVDPFDYEVRINADQLRRLEAIFPSGVCDWGAFGDGQTIPSMPDRSYEDEDTPGRRA